MSEGNRGTGGKTTKAEKGDRYRERGKARAGGRDTGPGGGKGAPKVDAPGKEVGRRRLGTE